MGDDGPFQRFERSEISQDEFYAEFGRRLSDVAFSNESYRRYCKRVGIGKPSVLLVRPTRSSRVCPQNVRSFRSGSISTGSRCVQELSLSLAGSLRQSLRLCLFTILHEQLWAMMMEPATEPDPLVVDAINSLRG